MSSIKLTDSFALGISLFASVILVTNNRIRNRVVEEFFSDKKPVKSWNEKIFYPPLPLEIVDLLKLSKLCFLATVNDSEPHLSLMNFTYFQQDEVLIVCSRRDTKKYFQLQLCPNVAILIHDFPHLASINDKDSYSQQVSITLNGVASILSNDDPLSLMYRSVKYYNI